MKKKCVKFLLSCGANPNVKNSHTGMTPLHWAARWGDKQIVEDLVNNKSKPACMWIPDYMGYTPIDYAGKFNHKEIVNFLIKEISKKCEVEYVKKRTSSGKNVIPKDKSIFEYQNDLLINPLLRSSLLYWAATLPESMFKWRDMYKLMQTLHCFPEYKCGMDAGKTSLHSATIANNWKKLKLLCQNLSRRYMHTPQKNKAIKEAPQKSQIAPLNTANSA